MRRGRSVSSGRLWLVGPGETYSALPAEMALAAIVQDQAQKIAAMRSAPVPVDPLQPSAAAVVNLVSHLLRDMAEHIVRQLESFQAGLNSVGAVTNGGPEALEVLLQGLKIAKDRDGCLLGAIRDAVRSHAHLVVVATDGTEH